MALDEPSVSLMALFAETIPNTARTINIHPSVMKYPVVSKSSKLTVDIAQRIIPITSGAVEAFSS